MSFQITSWCTRVTRTKKKREDSRYRLFLSGQQLLIWVLYQRKSNRKLYQDFKEEVCLRFVLSLLSQVSRLKYYINPLLLLGT